MSQNIVAICDCDTTLLDGRLQAWKTQADGWRPGPAAGRARPRRPRVAGRAGPPPSPWRDFETSKAQLAADARWSAADQNATLQRFANQQLPRLKKYRDYREMFDQQKDIDAVIIATPDHMHAPIASAAMALGKHIYVQKPMCWSVAEARHLGRQAAEKKVVALMGNQNHSRDNVAPGDRARAVRRDRRRPRSARVDQPPAAYWPQGIPRPAAMTGDACAPGRRASGASAWRARREDRHLSRARTLSWDLFLGCAPVVDYHPLYHPFNWRGWVDWGQGALGDMGAHLMDFPHWALRLGLPTSIQTISTPFNDVCYPIATTTISSSRRVAACRP